MICIFIFNTGKCPSGWHHYEKTASCYKVYLRSENYWQAVETCQKVNGSLATFSTNEELQFILKIEVDFDEKVCERKDQCKWVWESGFWGRGELLWFWVLNAVDVLRHCRFWVGYQYVITNQNHSLEGRWEVAYKGWYSSQIIWRNTVNKTKKIEEYLFFIVMNEHPSC